MRTEARATCFALIALCYLAAVLVGVFVFTHLSGEAWLRLLVADIAATMVIWVGSLLFDNASVYDPYWSVQPLVILDLWLYTTGTSDTASLLLCLVVNLWGIRLTVNWASTFRGLHIQDWRYDLIRNRTDRLYPIVSLIGIQLMPTLIVYACILPAFLFVTQGGGFSVLTATGFLVCLAGLTLEAVSDHQMHAFRRQNEDRTRINRNGLWQHSRHPNYLGEIMMWWGVFLFLLAARPQAWYLGIGALLNTLLFLFISIPMAETRLAGYKSDFPEYRKRTRVLLPLPKAPE